MKRDCMPWNLQPAVKELLTKTMVVIPVDFNTATTQAHHWKQSWVVTQVFIGAYELDCAPFSQSDRKLQNAVPYYKCNENKRTGNNGYLLITAYKSIKPKARTFQKSLKPIRK